MKTQARVLTALLLLTIIPMAAWGAPTKEALNGLEEVREIDWERTAKVILFVLPTEQLTSDKNEIVLRAREGESPLLVERFSFASPATLDVPRSLRGGQSDLERELAASRLPLAVQLLAREPEVLDRLWSRLEGKEEVLVEIAVNGEQTFAGTLSELISTSDALRDTALILQPTDSKVADLSRDGPRPGSLQKGPCEDDCYTDYAECQVDFCYWEPDEYMCDIGCDEELDQCLDDCVGWVAPTCTPSVITTTSSTTLISSSFQGLSCLADIFAPFGSSVYYYAYLNTYRTTFTEIRRRADCSTYSVVVGSSTSTRLCYRQSGLSCFGGFLFPSCWY